MILRENMVKTPAAVMHFLKQCHSHILPLAQKEYQGLLAEKSKVEGNCDKISNNHHEGLILHWFRQIYAYDLPYYKKLMRSSKESYEQLNAESAAYLSLSNCIDGLNIVSQKVALDGV